MCNLFQTIRFIRYSLVAVNKSYVPYVNFIVRLGNHVNFKPLIKGSLYKTLLLQSRRKSMLFNPSRYLYVSIRFFCFFTKRYPLIKDLVYQ